MSLNRKTRKKSAVEDEDILDSTEQEALVEEFRAEARRQAKRARIMFQILFIVAACCYLGCFVNGILLPWDMDHESVFKDLIPYETFQVYYAFSFVTFLVLSAIVRVCSDFCLVNEMNKMSIFRCVRINPEKSQYGNTR